MFVKISKFSDHFEQCFKNRKCNYSLDFYIFCWIYIVIVLTLFSHAVETNSFKKFRHNSSIIIFLIIDPNNKSSNRRLIFCTVTYIIITKKYSMNSFLYNLKHFDILQRPKLYFYSTQSTVQNRYSCRQWHIIVYSFNILYVTNQRCSHKCDQLQSHGRYSKALVTIICYSF